MKVSKTGGVRRSVSRSRQRFRVQRLQLSVNRRMVWREALTDVPQQLATPSQAQYAAQWQMRILRAALTVLIVSGYRNLYQEFISKSCNIERGIISYYFRSNTILSCELMLYVQGEWSEIFHLEWQRCGLGNLPIEKVLCEIKSEWLINLSTALLELKLAARTNEPLRKTMKIVEENMFRAIEIEVGYGEWPKTSNKNDRELRINLLLAGIDGFMLANLYNNYGIGK